MKAILCTKFGGPDSLIYAETENPVLTPDSVIIEVNYCGVNFPDTLIIQGTYQFKPDFPFSPGGEIAGKVLAIGAAVTNCKIGDHVMALCGWGGMAEQIVVKASHVFVIPDALDLAVAATSMYTWGTAYYALKNKAGLKQGQTILILGAAGGVGTTAILLSKLMGARVIAAASSNEKLAYCKSLGADECINYTTENLKESIKKLTNHAGVDIVYDPIGGSLAMDALKALSWNGQYLIIGFASGNIPEVPMNIPLLKGITIHGIFWGAFAEKEAKANKENLLQLMSWIMSGQLKQPIHRVYTLDQAPMALTELMQRTIKGKAVIQIKAANQSQPTTSTTSILQEPKNNTDSALNKLIIDGKAGIFLNIGKTVGPGQWITITQDMINAFAETTKDHQWVHVDEARAAKYLPDGRTLAHGYLTMSMVSYLLYELIELKQVSSFYNYGFNKARFISPVRVNDQICLTVKLEHAETQTNGSVKLILLCTIHIKGIEKPAYVAEIISVIN